MEDYLIEEIVDQLKRINDNTKKVNDYSFELKQINILLNNMNDYSFELQETNRRLDKINDSINSIFWLFCCAGIGLLIGLWLR